MPAKSEKQRKLMAAARAYKRGEYEGEPSEEVKRIAESMSDEELTDFMKKEGGLDNAWKSGLISALASGGLTAAMNEGDLPSSLAAAGIGGALGGGIGLMSPEGEEDLTDEELEALQLAMRLEADKRAAMRKTAEEYVDAQLAKRASCGRSHGDRAKNRAKHAAKLKKDMRKQASESTEIPENAIQRIDDAVDGMLRKMAADLFDPVPGRKGIFDDYGPGAVPQTVEVESLGDRSDHYAFAGTAGLGLGAGLGKLFGDDPSDTITGGLVGAGAAPLLLAIYRLKRKQDYALDKLMEDGNVAGDAPMEKNAFIGPDIKPTEDTAKAIKDRLDVMGGAAAGAGVGGLVTGLTGDEPDYATGAILGGGTGALLTILAKMYKRNALDPEKWIA